MMSKRVFYEKTGRKYSPVSEHDTGLLLSLCKGAHLLIIEPGTTATYHCINPDLEHAKILTALKQHRPKLEKILSKASELRPREIKMSRKELKAWKAYRDIMGEQVPCMFEYASYGEVLDKLESELIRVIRNQYY